MTPTIGVLKRSDNIGEAPPKAVKPPRLEETPTPTRSIVWEMAKTAIGASRMLSSTISSLSTTEASLTSSTAVANTSRSTAVRRFPILRVWKYFVFIRYRIRHQGSLVLQRTEPHCSSLRFTTILRNQNYIYMHRFVVVHASPSFIHSFLLVMQILQ